MVVEVVTDMYFGIYFGTTLTSTSHIYLSSVLAICIIRVTTLSYWCIHTSPFISTRDYHTIYSYPCWAIYIIRLTFIPSCYIYTDLFTSISTFIPTIYIIGCTPTYYKVCYTPPIIGSITPPPVTKSIAVLPFLQGATHAARLHVWVPRGHWSLHVRRVLPPLVPSNSTGHVDDVS